VLEPVFVTEIVESSELSGSTSTSRVEILAVKASAEFTVRVNVVCSVV